jgi:hypothetical protein
MSRGVRRQVPVVIAVVVVLVAALGGTVYAAGKINGHAIKVKSLPGNRVALKSLPGNRLKPGTVRAEMLAPGSVGREQLAPGSVGAAQLAPGSIAGIKIDLTSLGQVPDATHAERADVADTAQAAKDAETALHAGTAENAKSLDGYEAGCKTGTRLFAGACWQSSTNGPAVSPTAAAAGCTSQGGELPDPLALAAFANEPEVTIAAPEEWTSDLTNVSGPNSYSVLTVNSDSEVDFAGVNTTHKYRCVIPLLG